MRVEKSKFVQILLIISYSIFGLYLFRILIPNILQCGGNGFAANSCYWSKPNVILYFFRENIFHFGPEEILFISTTSMSVFLFHKSKFKLIEFASTIYFGLLIFIFTVGFFDKHFHIPDEVFQIILPIILPIIFYYNYNYETYYAKQLFNKLLKFLRF